MTAHPASDLAQPTGVWSPTPLPGVEELVLRRDDRDPEVVTRLLKLSPGAHTRPAGPFVHEFWEEVYLLHGSLSDVPTGQRSGPGAYACRPPGTPHGPIESDTGCTVLEVRYR